MRLLATFSFFIFFVTACQFFSTKKNDRQQPTHPALDAINKKINEQPKDATLYYKRGSVYHQLTQDSLALVDFKQAIQIDSTKAEYYSAIGELLFEHKDISGSVPYFEKAIALNPNDETAHLKMAKLFLYIAEYPKAFNEINTVLRSNVYNPEAYFLKGMCYKGMKDTNKAISSFQTCVQTEPKYAEGHLQLAFIYEAKKNPLALQYFENAFRADSSNLEPLYGAGMFWQNQEKYEEAKKVFRRIITINKDYEKSYYNLGWIYMQQDSLEKAIRQFNVAVQVKPDYADAYYNRGLCNELLQNIVEAKQDYEQCLNLDTEHTMAKKALQMLNK
jgi:tetratricopeptide (TPR) repeat protein